MNYILKDHLGSIQYVTDDQGNVVETLSFDPWGRRRNPVDWSYNGIQSSFLFDRGFTMHEHLDEFSLINMNGRMYDPLVNRFLSPDPFTEAPHSLQGLNRYSYLMNNPMNGIDPTGYFIRPSKDGGGSITGAGPNFDFFEFVPSIFDQIDESVKRRASKYSALSYEELLELKKRDKEEADKAKSSKENANSKNNDNSKQYNPSGSQFKMHFKGGMMNDGSTEGGHEKENKDENNLKPLYGCSIYFTLHYLWNTLLSLEKFTTLIQEKHSSLFQMDGHLALKQQLD